MNAKMAPVDHSNGYKGQNGLAKELSKRKRDGGFGGGDGSKRGNGNGNSNSNSNNANYNNNNNNNGGNNKSDDSEKNGNGQEKDHDPPASQFIPASSFQAATPPSIAQITSTAVTTVPTTVVITSTTPVSSSSTSISSSIPIMSTAPTLISSSFPTTTSILTSMTSLTSPADTSSQQRKGLNTDGDDPSTTHTKTKAMNTQSTAATAFAETAAASASSSLELPAQPNPHDGDKNQGLSPTAEHLLIAFGAIGVFIIFITAVYFIARMKKVDLFSKARGREFTRGGPRGWYGWRGKEPDYTMDAPPKYTGYDESFEYTSEQKPVPAQRQLDAFFSPTSMPTLATPESAAALSRADTQRQETVREALLENPAPFGVIPAQPAEQSATQAFYNQNASYDPNPTYNQTFNTNTTAGGLSRQTSDAYDPAQREVNHMSYLSSLSSGFGDQIIIPESGPTKPANVRASRQSYRQSRKFSWAISARGPQGDRDTVYTTASIDSTPPRFRTINSWVAQQTGRVQRQNQSKDEVPSMPAIPKPLQVGVAANHQRNESEDPAFKHHPGDEIELSKGSRIPSTILDKKFGIN